MNKYEAMFIVKPDLSEDDRKTLFNFIGETVTKHGGMISNSGVWAEKRKLYFPIKKQGEGVYYLLSFALPPKAVKDITHAYGLNENILRVLVSNLE
jgi:small subunit ribosomal protein S6